MTTRANAAYHFPPFHPKLQRHKRADRRVHKARLKKLWRDRRSYFYWNGQHTPSERDIGVEVSTHGTKYSSWEYGYDPMYERHKVNTKNPPMPEIQTHEEMQALIQEDEGKMVFWRTTYQSVQDWEDDMAQFEYHLSWDLDEELSMVDDDWYDDGDERPSYDDEYWYDYGYDSFNSQMNRRYIEFAQKEHETYLSLDQSTERHQIEAWLHDQIKCEDQEQPYNGEVYDGLNPESPIQRLYWDKGVSLQNITNQMF